jgi:hypothetical protein
VHRVLKTLYGIVFFNITVLEAGSPRFGSPNDLASGEGLIVDGIMAESCYRERERERSLSHSETGSQRA